MYEYLAQNTSSGLELCAQKKTKDAAYGSASGAGKPRAGGGLIEGTAGVPRQTMTITHLPCYSGWSCLDGTAYLSPKYLLLLPVTLGVGCGDEYTSNIVTYNEEMDVK